ncbi:MAG: hypothetical protein LBC99_08270 [Spirochaetota bacterium]|jgi:hypothetical protein|nr:hypothetical protein [Spirochaetota bacterium]
MCAGGLRKGYAFVRDVYGLTVPVVLLAVLLLCMAFLRAAALVIIVLPCAALLILTFFAAYCILGRGETQSPIEERLYRLLASDAETARFSVPGIVQSLNNGDQAAIAEALSNLYASALLTFFWEKKTGTVLIPGREQNMTSCPVCGAMLVPGNIHGVCGGCGITYVVSERKKPFHRL